MRYRIGLDIGGTKMLGCLFEADGIVPVARLEAPTAHASGGDAVLQQAVAMRDALRQNAPGPVDAVGVALPELVNNTGQPASAWSFEWRGLDVAAAFGDACPVTIESDVRVAALAESRLSELRHCDPLLYVTLSTGLSHTLMIGGKPYRGARGFAMHFASSDLWVECGSCGESGPFNIEMRMGGRALGERWAAQSGDETRTARDMFDASTSDPAAARLAGSAVVSLASYLAQLINILDPAGVIIGGGIGTRADLFDEITKRTRAFIWAEDARDLPIRPSRLNGLGPAIGAVMAATPAKEPCP